MLTWIDIRKENSGKVLSSSLHENDYLLPFCSGYIAMLEDFINGKLKTHCIDAKHLELHITEKMIQLCRENGEVKKTKN